MTSRTGIEPGTLRPKVRCTTDAPARSTLKNKFDFMAPKLIIVLYVHSKEPHYNRVSLITQSASMDPKDSVIRRLYCTISHIDCTLSNSGIIWK